MAASSAELEISALNPHVGAEILGVDLASVDDDDVTRLRKCLGEWGVIFFRDQMLTPEQHIAFAKRWSTINVNRFFARVEGYEQIAEVRKEADQDRNIGGSWHTDHSYDQAPALGSILIAREVPATGGDTLFASMYAAYDSLSEDLKQTVGTLRALHSSRHAFGPEAQRDREFRGRLGNAEQAVQDAVHPIVIRHPESGRSALYVNPGFTLAIEGWPEDESRDLLAQLYEHASREEHVCRFNWTRHAVAIWDNRATWHRAMNDYSGQRRLMHRVTLNGVPLEAAFH